MNKKHKIIINDYSGLPSIFDLAAKLALNGYQITYITSKQVNLGGNYYKTYSKNKNLIIKFIKTKSKIKKDSFFSRRNIEIEYGERSWEIISTIKPKYCFFISLPIDPLYDLIKKNNKNEIKSIFWIQDIYFLAIKEIINSKIPIIGTLISKIYQYKENYCYNNSFKNILIDKTFNQHFFNKRKDNILIKNWIPRETRSFSNQKNNFFNKFKKKYSKIYVYAGTIGYKHSPKIFIKLSKLIKDSLIIVISSGKFFNQLKKVINEQNLKNIKLLNRFNSFQQLLRHLNKNLIGLVHINKHASSYSVPSKILTYINCGMPIVGFIPKKNQAAQIIQKNNLGVILDNNNLDKINQINTSKFKIMSKNCFNYANKNFNTKIILNKIKTQIINDKN